MTLPTIILFVPQRATDIDGNPVALSKYADKVTLVVNVASLDNSAGYTDMNYGRLMYLYNKYRPDGLEVSAAHKLRHLHNKSTTSRATSDVTCEFIPAVAALEAAIHRVCVGGACQRTLSGPECSRPGLAARGSSVFRGQ